VKTTLGWLLPVLVLGACAGTVPPPAAPPPAAMPAAAPSAPGPAAAPAAGASPADPAPAPLAAELPFDPQVHEGRFANGFTYLIRANREPAGRAELWLVVDAGSVLEDDDQRGLAHLVEHMAFNGTRHFAKQELVAYLESIGMRFGPDVNASTSFDETLYTLRVPTDDPKIVATAFEILEDWAHEVSFEDDEIDKERGVVIEEWRLGRGADARLLDQQYPVLFAGSRYAERLPIGEVETLQHAPAAAVRRFYRDWYRPDLMALVAVGDFDPATIEELARRHFAALPAPEHPRPRPAFTLPAHRATVVSIATDPEATDTTVGIYAKHPQPPEGTYGDYRRSLVEGLFDGMLDARLGEIAQRPDAPFLWATSAVGSLVRPAEVYHLVAGVEETGVEAGLTALLTEATRVDRHGFLPGELERAKKDLLRGYEEAYQERDKSDSRSYAAECTRHFLTGEPIPGIAVELALVRRFLGDITLDEVDAQAHHWLGDEDRVILLSAPAKATASLPGEDELRATAAKVAASDLAPWVDRVREEPLLAAAPAPGKVASETEIPELGVTEWRLSNGVRVVLKPTDFKNDQVLLTAFSPGGDSLASDADYLSAGFATAAVAAGGLGSFDAVELDKALAGKRAAVSPYVGELEEGVNGYASPQDLDTLLQLVYLTFTAPRADPEAFATLLAKTRLTLENRLASPENVFADRFGQALYQDHPRRRVPTPEDLDRVDLDAALAFYRQRFADASDFTFILVGSFQPDRVRPLVETYLGGLPATDRKESWRDVGVETPPGVVKVEVAKGLEPKSRVQIVFSGPAPWSREQLHLINTLADVLGTRLREVLREELGATYGVAVSGSLSPRPRPEYRFSIGFGCAPDKADELVDQTFREIDRMREEGVAATYVANAREAQQRARQTQLADNGFWAQVLKTYYSLDLDPRLILAYDQLIALVTPEALQAAARRYLDPDRYVLGILHPEAGAPTSPGPSASGSPPRPSATIPDGSD
jgi:zinc protease